MLTFHIDIWFHRYVDGRDIEGRFDYNSWQESERGLALADSLSKDTVLAEGEAHGILDLRFSANCWQATVST